MATHSSTLAWKIPWTEEPGGLQSIGSQRAGHDRATKHTWVLEGKTSPQLPHTKIKVWLGAWRLCPKKCPHQLPLIWSLSVSPLCVFHLTEMKSWRSFPLQSITWAGTVFYSHFDRPAVDSQVKKKKNPVLTSCCLFFYALLARVVSKCGCL